MHIAPIGTEANARRSELHITLYSNSLVLHNVVEPTARLKSNGELAAGVSKVTGNLVASRRQRRHRRRHVVHGVVGS